MRDHPKPSGTDLTGKPMRKGIFSLRLKQFAQAQNSSLGEVSFSGNAKLVARSVPFFFFNHKPCRFTAFLCVFVGLKAASCYNEPTVKKEGISHG